MRMGKITSFQYFLILIFTISFCKKPVDKIIIETRGKKNGNHLSAVVVFSLGSSKIYHSDLTEEKAKIGAYFRNGDRIETGEDAKVDIQIGGNSVIRIPSNAILEFTTLSRKNSQSTAVITLLSGKLYANIDKLKSEDSYSFLTPFSNAAIKGTSFILEIQNTFTLIKVTRGKVVYNPRLPKKILNLGNPEITKIQDKLTASQINIEAGNQGKILINPKLFSEQSQKSDSEHYQSIMKNLSGIHVDLDKLEITKREEQELNTIIKIEPEKSFKMIRLNEELSSGIIDEARAEKLENDRQEIETEISKMQEVKKVKFNDTIAKNPKTFKSKQEIIKYYERMEKIVLKSGKIEIGAIIDQLGTSKIVVHTENGIKRIPMEIVKEIIYDFKSR